MADFQSKYQTELTKIESRAKSAKRFLDRYGKWLRRYKGGLPVGFLAAIGQWESDGRMDSAGDVSRGEYGFFQITDSTEREFGLPSGFRTRPENNIWLAGLEYNVEAKRLALRYSFIKDGTRDQWMLARLTFAVGRSGTYKLIDNAVAGGYMTGAPYAGVLAYVNAVGGIKLGEQSPGKVWFRVNAIPLVWQIGERVESFFFLRLPVQPPAPYGVRYVLPADVRAHLPSEGASLFAMGAMVVISLALPGV